MLSIETDRLLIRDHVLDDLVDHHRLISNDEVMRFISDIKTADLEGSKENLLFAIREAEKMPRTHFFFAMISKETQAHIGSIGLTMLEIGDSGHAEMGYFIHKEFWGQGYTTEAARAILNYAFDELGLIKITTGCVYDNHSSENIMIKLGMFKESHLHYHTFIEGQWRDRVTYGIYNLKLVGNAFKQWLTMVQIARCCFETPHYFIGDVHQLTTSFEKPLNPFVICFRDQDKQQVMTYFKNNEMIVDNEIKVSFVEDFPKDLKRICRLNEQIFYKEKQ